MENLRHLISQIDLGSGLNIQQQMRVVVYNLYDSGTVSAEEFCDALMVSPVCLDDSYHKFWKPLPHWSHEEAVQVRMALMSRFLSMEMWREHAIAHGAVVIEADIHDSLLEVHGLKRATPDEITRDLYVYFGATNPTFFHMLVSAAVICEDWTKTTDGGPILLAIGAPWFKPAYMTARSRATGAILRDASRIMEPPTWPEIHQMLASGDVMLQSWYAPPSRSWSFTIYELQEAEHEYILTSDGPNRLDLVGDAQLWYDTYVRFCRCYNLTIILKPPIVQYLHQMAPHVFAQLNKNPDPLLMATSELEVAHPTIFYNLYGHPNAYWQIIYVHSGSTATVAEWRKLLNTLMWGSIRSIQCDLPLTLLCSEYRGCIARPLHYWAGVHSDAVMRQTICRRIAIMELVAEEYLAMPNTFSDIMSFWYIVARLPTDIIAIMAMRWFAIQQRDYKRQPHDTALTKPISLAPLARFVWPRHGILAAFEWALAA